MKHETRTAIPKLSRAPAHIDDKDFVEIDLNLPIKIHSHVTFASDVVHSVSQVEPKRACLKGYSKLCLVIVRVVLVLATLLIMAIPLFWIRRR